MKVKITKNSIINFLVLTIFFDAYCFYQSGDRGFTLWYVGAFFLFFFVLCKFNSVIEGIIANPYAFLMIIYMIINYVYLGKNGINSLMIGCLCWTFYVCSYRKCTVNEFTKTVELFSKAMNISAIYGIYQVIAYYFDFPFKNPWIEGFMVEGFNWGNTISIGNLTLNRAHALFREPAFFAQFLAINILIYIQKIISKNKTNNRNIIIWLIVNFTAMMLSFSGTGILIVGFGIILLLLSNKRKDTLLFLKKYRLIIIPCVLGAFLLLIVPNPLIDYLLSRLSEFDATNMNSVSGYLRMVFPYQVSMEILSSQSCIMGLGIGNASIYASKKILQSGRVLTDFIQPILPRTIVEEGIIGLVILICFFIKTYKRENINIPSYKAILFGTYIMSFMHGTWSSEVFWLFLAILNIKIIDCNSDNAS